MFTVKIDNFVFGYRKIKISKDLEKKVLSLLLREKIPAQVFFDGTVLIRERDFAKFKKILNGWAEYEASETLGLYGFYKKIKYKKTIFMTSAFMLIFLYFLSNLVWDIRVSGNENISDAKIVSALYDNGFCIGKPWMFADRSEIENNMLLCVDEIGWININRRGGVAYVEIIEKEKRNEATETEKYFSNIVASADCVIEEITVLHGVAAVKPGDVVRKGDLLISGVLTDKGFCRAEGIVMGRMSDTVTVNTDRNYIEKIEIGENLCSLTVNFFDFSLNILKIYGNLPEECDIIEDVREYTLFGACKLPFYVTREYAKKYEMAEGSYSSEELVEITARRLASAVHSRLISAELLKIKTYGEFTESGYKMYSNIVFSSDIGVEVRIDVE